MHILITGANSYIGTALTQTLLANAELGGKPITRLTRTDLQLPHISEAPAWLHDIEGDLCQASVRHELLTTPVDYVFHLAGITSKRAEADLDLSLAVNLHATLQLVDALRHQNTCPTFVFTSSIGVYGAPLPTQINDDTPIQPALSYGTHKRMAELLIADYTRLGHIDGRTVRLSGVIARPADSIPALSTFSSDLLRHLAAGKPYTCPVSPEASHWLMSLPCCIEQLLLAASSSNTLWPSSRAVTLPPLRVSTGELVDSLAKLYGEQCHQLVDWQPLPHIEAQFGRWPVLHTHYADQIGFKNDQSVENLITRALAH